MTPDLAQLADEATTLRHDCVEAALGRIHIGRATAAGLGPVDHLDQARTRLAAAWDDKHPGLAKLAGDRRAEAGAR